MSASRKEDRGEYRPMYASILQDEHFHSLSVVAKWLFVELKLRLGPAGIGLIRPAALAESAGCTIEDVDAALTDLEKPKEGLDHGWIVRDSGAIWLVRGLHFESNLSPANWRHRKPIQNALKPIGNKPIARQYRAYYAAWFADADTLPDRVSDRVSQEVGPADGSAKGFDTHADHGDRNGNRDGVQKSSLSPAREETSVATNGDRRGVPVRTDPSWPEPVMQFLQRRGEGLVAWTAAFLGMLQGLGAPSGRAVTVEQIAQACIEIEQLGGEISPRRFRRVLAQVTEPAMPTSSRTGVAGDDAEVVASKKLQELVEHRDPLHPHTLTAEGWKLVSPEQREAIKSIGGMERILNAKPEHWMFVVRDYLKATRGAGRAKAQGTKSTPRRAATKATDAAETIEETIE